MIQINAKNFNQLKNELKSYEGRAIFKLTRIQSLNDGEFLRVLHQVKPNKFIFWDGQRESTLDINSAKDIEIIENGFIMKNCKYELLEIK